MADDTNSQNYNTKELNSVKCNWLRAVVYAEEGFASSSDNFNFIFGDEVNPNEDTFEIILKLTDKDGKYRDIQTIAFNQIENKITQVNLFETSQGKLIGLEFFSGDTNIGVIGDHLLMADLGHDSIYEKKTELIKDDEQIIGFYAYSYKRQLFCFEFEICELTDKEFEN